MRRSFGMIIKPFKSLLRDFKNRNPKLIVTMGWGSLRPPSPWFNGLWLLNVLKRFSKGFIIIPNDGFIIIPKCHQAGVSCLISLKVDQDGGVEDLGPVLAILAVLVIMF